METLKTHLQIYDLSAGRMIDAIALSAILALVTEMLERAVPGRNYRLNITGEMRGTFSTAGMVEVKQGFGEGEAGLIVSLKETERFFICVLTRERTASSGLFEELVVKLDTSRRYYHNGDAPVPTALKALKRARKKETEEQSVEEKEDMKYLKDIVERVEDSVWWSLMEVFETIFKFHCVAKRSARPILRRLVKAGFLDVTGRSPHNEYKVTAKGRQVGGATELSMTFPLPSSIVAPVPMAVPLELVTVTPVNGSRIAQ